MEGGLGLTEQNGESSCRYDSSQEEGGGGEPQ